MPSQKENQQHSSEQRSTGHTVNENISAVLAAHSSHPAGLITDSKAWLASFARRKAHGEILSETDLVFRATAQEMLADGAAKFVEHNESVIPVVAEIKAGRALKRDVEDAEELTEGIARCVDALQDVDSEDRESKERCLSAFLELPEDFEERSGKSFSQLFGLLDEEDKSADNEVEPETLEQHDRRIKEEEANEMREATDEAAPRIDDWENAWKFYWSLVDGDLRSDNR
jgi:hypothetical protein